MITQTSELGMGLGRFCIVLRVVGVAAMPDGGLDTTWLVESVCAVALGAGVIQLLLPRLVVAEFIDHVCVMYGVEATRGFISAT
jgi:cyanate permease